MFNRNFNPLNELVALQRDLTRLFDDPQSYGLRFVSDPFGQSGATNARSLNLSENPDEYVVEVLTPGYEPETLDVNVLGRQLTVSGERNAPASEDGESVHRSERSFGKFSRTIQLPANVKEDEISAEYKYGVLTISLPKAEEAKPRRINVAS